MQQLKLKGSPRLTLRPRQSKLATGDQVAAQAQSQPCVEAEDSPAGEA